MKIRRLLIGTGITLVAVVGTSVGVYAHVVSNRILPNTWAGTVPLGGLTRQEALERVAEAQRRLQNEGILVSVNGSNQPISPDTIGFDVDISVTVENAFRRGREGSWLKRFGATVASLVSDKHGTPIVALDEKALRTQVGQIATVTGTQPRGVRLSVTGSSVKLLTDITPGKSIDQVDVAARTATALRQLDNQLIAASLEDQAPQGDPATGAAAVQSARAMLARALTLQYEELFYTISRDRIGSWITTGYDGDTVQAVLDNEKIAMYVTGIATTVNVAPLPPKLTTVDGRITGFAPSKVGRSVEETKLAELIMSALVSRTSTSPLSDLISIPVKATQMGPIGLDTTTGITELIGAATTPFTGSPKNRILNIKNGVKFLTGTVIQPGAEFSTLGTLGVIDNTTGYLPELVIKGDRTTPEFGGGLCQVSTTLFRSVLNAGLPITERHNHSFRVSYYEKDGDGTYIGPGLDATIYEPDLDFKFRNDTATPILIIGYVIGDKITFELYGTHDGRVSKIDGPKTLTETPPGDPVYIDTTDLDPGVIKQVETPHPGGSASATYTVTYADGHSLSQVFRSWYRPWPIKYLRGVAASPSPLPETP